MKSTLISKENNEAKLTMEFMAEEFEDAVVKVYKTQKDKFSIDGFRKGKAPRSIIEKHYGEGIFFEDAINNLFSLHYPLALDELDLDVIDSPRAEFSQVKKNEGFTVTITVMCSPEVEVKDYKNIEIEKIEAKVEDEDVQKEIDDMAKKNSRMVLVDRPAQDGDIVLIDYEGWVGDNQFEGGTAERQPLKLGSNTFIPGFEEQLIGVKNGEDKDVKVTFPEEYHAEDLAGKEAVFKCKIHEIKEQELPEINDDFVKDISEFDTLDELKADTREKLEKQAAESVESRMKNSAIEMVYNANEIDIPDVMVESEIDNMMSEFDQQLRSQGMDLTNYFKYIGKEPKEFRDEIKDDAFRKVKTRLIISAVAKQEGFEASQEDIDNEIDGMAKMYNLEADKIREMLGDQNMDMISGDIKMKKAVDFIYDSAIKK
ncbi:MAG: trigger factor [Clostridiales bacterium]|nr:trigger factor [Clostridiales bacterium]